MSFRRQWTEGYEPQAPPSGIGMPAFSDAFANGRELSHGQSPPQKRREYNAIGSDSCPPFCRYPAILDIGSDNICIP